MAKKKRKQRKPRRQKKIEENLQIVLTVPFSFTKETIEASGLTIEEFEKMFEKHIYKTFQYDAI